MGEGGSGNWWMKTEHIMEICEKLVDGGLIVTDGSQSGGKMYRLLARFSGTQRFSEKDGIPVTAGDFVRERKSFTDDRGRTFTCIGFAGYRYGPTLIWQVKKPSITKEAIGSLLSKITRNRKRPPVFATV